MDIRKARHDIKSDTEAVKTVIALAKEQVEDESMRKLLETSLVRMDKIQNDFLELLESNQD
jgi:hypothetical protein